MKMTNFALDTSLDMRLLNESILLNKEGKFNDAIAKADSAQQLFAKLLGEETKAVADALHQKAKNLYALGHYDEAINESGKALAIQLNLFGESNADVAASFNNFGSIYNAKGEYDKAIEYHNKALNIRRIVLGEDHLDVANSLSNVANSCNFKGEYDRAIKYLEKALSIRSKLLRSDSPVLAATYNNLANSYYYKGEYDKALESQNKALEIRLKSQGVNHPDVATSYNNFGNLYVKTGDYKKANLCYEKSLSIRTNALGAEHSDVAACYNNLGVLYKLQGNYDKAIQYHDKALFIRLKTLGGEHPNVAASYNNIGTLYFYKKEYDKAITYLDKALIIRMKKLGSSHPDLADLYNDYGNVYIDMNDYDKAIGYHQKALEIWSKVLGEEHSSVAIACNNLSASYFYKKEPEKAIEYSEKALAIFKSALGEQHPYVANTYNKIADIYRLTERFDQAVLNYQAALNVCRYQNRDFSKVTSIQELLVSLNLLSATLQKQFIQMPDKNLLNESYELAQQALAAIDYQQSTFNEIGNKAIWLNFNYGIYEQLMNVSLMNAKVNYDETLHRTCFSYVERSKASLLQAQIKSADALSFSGIPDTLVQQEHQLRVDITWREKQRQALLDKGLAETDTNTLRISSIIFDLKRDYEALKQHLETQYPEYYRLKYDLSTVSLQHVQDTLLEPKNQALLEYFVGDSSIYLFVVRPDTMIVQEVKRDFPLEDWIEGLRYGIYGYYAADKATQTDSLKADAKRAYLEFAPKLYQKLVAPIAQYLPEKVILVPDGPLGYVPFDALLTAAPEDANNFKSYPYLIQKHQFSYTYSATLLREMRDKKHRQEPQKDFVAFAPFYNGDTTLLANMFAYDDLMRKDLQPLAFSGPEVAAASKLMNGETVAGTAATEEKFTSIASNYRIIHLATHGRADNRVGDYAFLAFTEIKDSLENELLYVKDLYNLQLNADLVVLSACETGIGKLQRGEGIISLARAFAYAGAKSIVTSLWSVNDKSTSELMRLFYRELQRGKDKDEALRLARLRFLKESSVKNSHPFFWAAFVPLGDMRPVR